MDVGPLALLVPGGVLVGLILALTALGERLRDRLAR
jgi:oligopeptide transport system permease protein